MVRRIQALNYRCLRHVDVRLDGNFHILVGPNASGKTTLLDVIGFFADLTPGSIESAVRTRVPDFRELVWGRQGSGRFELAIELDAGNPSGESAEDVIRYEVAAPAHARERRRAGASCGWSLTNCPSQAASAGSPRPSTSGNVTRRTRLRLRRCRWSQVGMRPAPVRFEPWHRAIEYGAVTVRLHGSGDLRSYSDVVATAGGDERVDAVALEAGVQRRQACIRERLPVAGRFGLYDRDPTRGADRTCWYACRVAASMACSAGAVLMSA